VFVPAPVVEEKKSVIETVTVIVILPPSTVTELKPEPSELTTQKLGKLVDGPFAEMAPAKVLTKISVPKIAAFKGAGPFKFALSLTNQEDVKAIKDPELAIGLKVFSQTPRICTVSTRFNKSTGKYSISVTGIANGQCKITAADKGSDDKFPTATEIKQAVTGIATKKIVSAKVVIPKPAPKPAISKAKFKPSKG
jgi:hypothetical protein